VFLRAAAGKIVLLREYFDPTRAEGDERAHPGPRLVTRSPRARRTTLTAAVAFAQLPPREAEP
jgi:hypothetical protein